MDTDGYLIEYFNMKYWNNVIKEVSAESCIASKILWSRGFALFQGEYLNVKFNLSAFGSSPDVSAAPSPVSHKALTDGTCSPTNTDSGHTCSTLLI